MFGVECCALNVSFQLVFPNFTTDFFSSVNSSQGSEQALSGHEENSCLNGGASQHGAQAQ